MTIRVALAALLFGVATVQADDDLGSLSSVQGQVSASFQQMHQDRAARAQAAAARSSAKCVPAPPPAINDPQYKDIFKQGWEKMMDSLRKPKCAKVYFQIPVTDPVSLCQDLVKLAAQTTYSFYELSSEDFGAATYGDTTVTINSKGVFVNAHQDGIITLDRQNYKLWDETEIRGMVLLHELGHQVWHKFNQDPRIGWGPDRGSPDNAKHSLAVIGACFSANEAMPHHAGGAR